MELIIVGSGAAYPDRPGTASSTYLVRHGRTALCLDLGQGGFAGLAGRSVPEDLAAVVISHLHPDHFVDLVPLRHYLRHEFDPPRQVRVIAPAGLADRLDGVMGERGFSAPSLVIEVRRPGIIEIGPFRLESRHVTHTDDSYAVRITPAGDGRAPGLVYSGDCGRADDLALLLRPGDTLLTEIAWGAGPVAAPGIHLDGEAIGDLAAATQPGRVLLTHLQVRRDPSAALAALRRRWAGPAAFVGDGDRFGV